MLKTNPTVFAKVNHEAREVRDSLFGEAEFMLTNEGLGGLGGGGRLPEQAPHRKTYRALGRHQMYHYDFQYPMLLSAARICATQQDRH